jgi:hypothetical protein
MRQKKVDIMEKGKAKKASKPPMSVNIQYPDVKAGKKMIRVAWARSDQDMRGSAPARKYFGTARAREARQFAAEKAMGFGNGTFFTVVKPAAKGSTLNFYRVGGDKLIHRGRPGF